MLAEINLLPKKERRSYTLPIVAGIFMIVVLSIGSYLFYTYNNYKGELEKLTSNIDTTRQLIAIESAKKEETPVNSVTQLENFITWGKTYPIKAVPVMHEFVSMLPARGFFVNYSYTEQDTVQLTVRFDTSLEASSYLDELLASEWTTEVKMTSLQVTESYYFHQIIGIEQPDIPEMLNEDFVPRYEGIFEVKLHVDFIQNKQKQENNVASTSSSEEGDDSSE